MGGASGTGSLSYRIVEYKMTLSVKAVDMKLFATMVLMFISLFVVGLANAAEIREIHLDDGSSIVGEVVSVENGSYVISTKSLGTVTLASGQIKSISRVGAAANSASQQSDYGSPALNSTNAAPQSGLQSSIQQIQSSISSNASLMSSIMQMQDSPEMQAVLSDPELMSAIQRFDIEAIQSHPKIIRLMNSRDMQQIQSDVQ